MTILFALTLALQTARAPSADSVTISSPVAVVEVDAGKLKSEPGRLAWSPDGSELYLQLVRREKSGILVARHFLLTAGARATLKSVDQEPAWASKYWSWKSGRSAPGRPASMIEVESRQSVVRSTAAPMGGGLARGDPGGSAGGPGGLGGTGTGANPEDVASAARQTQTVTVYTLRFKGEVLGEWQNQPVVPGLTFGWAPSDLGLLAFVNKAGRFIVMDVEGRKRESAELKDARLPAWSEDGAKLAYLRPAGKNKFALMIATVTRS